MSLKKQYVRDGQRRIIGSVTTGYGVRSIRSSETSTSTSSDGRAKTSVRPATKWQAHLDQHH